jgi:hypothetical protein
VNDTADNILRAIDAGAAEIAPSTVFAVAAILEGCTFINGSPQNTLVPGVVALALRHDVQVLPAPRGVYITPRCIYYPALYDSARGWLCLTLRLRLRATTLSLDRPRSRVCASRFPFPRCVYVTMCPGARRLPRQRGHQGQQHSVLQPPKP